MGDESMKLEAWKEVQSIFRGAMQGVSFLRSGVKCLFIHFYDLLFIFGAATAQYNSDSDKLF